jgi:hypothetical protein
MVALDHLESVIIGHANCHALTYHSDALSHGSPLQERTHHARDHHTRYRQR